MEIKFINIYYPISDPYIKSITSKEFLAWAKTDLKGGDRRAMGNALSNIKKSIHSRIDEILNITHISYCRDWNSRDTTDKKISLLKKLNIEHTSIVKIITKIRNEYEHQYTLPKDPNDIRAYYETTELWLKNSEEKLIGNRLALVNLPIYSVEHDDNNFITVIEFPKYIDNFNIFYFWDRKKEIATLTKDNRDAIEKMNDYEMSQFINIEKNHLKKRSQEQPYFCQASTITKIFKTYKKTLDKVKYGFYLSNPRIEINKL